MSGKTITFKTRVAYGLGDTSCNIVMGMLFGLLVFFYTDYVGVSPLTVGIIMLISRIFDGTSDFIMGVIIDRTKSRWGKARPWLLWMAIPYAVSAVLIFTVPNSTDFVKAIYIFVTYNFTTTVVYTAINVSYGSLSTMMTRNSYQQDMLSIFRMVMSPVGRIISVSCTMPLVKFFGNDQAAWVKTMSIWSVIGVAMLLFCFFNCKEIVPANEEHEEKRSVLVNLKGVAGNFYFWSVLALWFAQNAHFTIVGTSLPYYCKYLLGDDTWMYSLLYFLETILMIGGAMLSPFLIRRLGKRNTTLAGAVLALFAQTLVLINPYNFTWILIITVIRSIGVSQLSACIFGMVGDAIEYGDWKNGFRQPSYVFGGASMGCRVGMGVTTAVMTAVMRAGGYISSTTADVVQPQSAIMAIKNMYIYGIMALWVFVIIILLFYKLDKIYPQIENELIERGVK